MIDFLSSLLSVAKTVGSLIIGRFALAAFLMLSMLQWIVTSAIDLVNEIVTLAASIAPDSADWSAVMGIMGTLEYLLPINYMLAALSTYCAALVVATTIRLIKGCIPTLG